MTASNLVKAVLVAVDGSGGLEQFMKRDKGDLHLHLHIHQHTRAPTCSVKGVLLGFEHCHMCNPITLRHWSRRWAGLRLNLDLLAGKIRCVDAQQDKELRVSKEGCIRANGNPFVNIEKSVDLSRQSS